MRVSPEYQQVSTRRRQRVYASIYLDIAADDGAFELEGAERIYTNRHIRPYIRPYILYIRPYILGREGPGGWRGAAAGGNGGSDG
jgi:hypothetical protein